MVTFSAMSENPLLDWLCQLVSGGPGILFIYLCIYLYIYILHMRISNQICSRTASQTNQRASTISPRSQLESHVCRLKCVYIYICVYIYVCVYMCEYDLLCLYTSHQIYVYIYTNIHLTNLMIYIYNFVCVSIFFHTNVHRRQPLTGCRT